MRLFVCQQDNGETTGPMFKKISGRLWTGPRKNPLHFGAAPKTRGGYTHFFSAFVKGVISDYRKTTG